MRNLIVPMAGKSSRFPNMRPKWMLTHPKRNKFMVTEAISGLNLDFFDSIYFVVLSEHERQYHFTKGFQNELDGMGIGNKSKIVYLDNQTESQSETVYQLIIKENLDGFIFIKDSDGYYKCTLTEDTNQVAYFDLNDMDGINARTKSYVQMDINNVITNIVEKQVISSTFSCGGYGFSDAKEFCLIYENLKQMEGECYISHIIFEMMLSGSVFYGIESKDFKDWGTLDVWKDYKKEYKTIFCDIDGTLITNSSIQFPPYVGEGNVIKGNVEYLKKLYDKGKTYIILTTSRPEYMRSITEDEMIKYDIPYDQLVMGLPHCKRVLVNDFARSNLYPSCEAINIPRNSETLEEYL